MTGEIIKFTKVRSATDPTFWAKFAELKIDKLKLDEKQKLNLWASYSFNPTYDGQINPLILDCTSFNEDMETTTHKMGVACYGYMINTNTYEAFRQINPQNFIDQLGQSVVNSIKDGTALKEPWKLSLFLVFSYADLKKYKFHYWVAHPAPFSLPEIYHEQPLKLANDKFSPQQLDKLSSGFCKLNCRDKNFFSVLATGTTDLVFKTVSEGVEFIQTADTINNENKGIEIYFCYYDPCATSDPGWPLRNLLCLLTWHCPSFCFAKQIKILSIRGDKAQRSVMFTLKIKNTIDQEQVRNAILEGNLVGWEMNLNGKMGPNIADLSNTIDPVKLSKEAINLNLKLMKWRLVPDLNLEKISRLRCLLLGAGTLGCAVARVLLGWGVDTMTLVDSSTVSHSNTVRQSLYTHQDAVQRKFKAEAARDALLNIRPCMNAKGVVLHIPMPGHVVGQSLLETTKESIRKLEDLIAQSDVVFLLLDSREARWLPTVLCAAMNKIAINAALGFDSYTVQRHGTRDPSIPISPELVLENPTGKELGCYFCNDVTQPGNSQTDRTLDQQCTVSRPGLSQIAAGLAVELMVAITQHPQGIEARALMEKNNDELRSNDADQLCGLLGGIPHTIRGSLWNHSMRLTITHRFPSCTACSIPLIKEYQGRGVDFVLDACNIPNYLEKLSGLEEILKRPDLDELCYAIDSSSEDENEVQKG